MIYVGCLKTIFHVARRWIILVALYVPFGRCTYGLHVASLIQYAYT